MKRTALALALVYAVVLSSSTLAQTQKPVETMPLEQIHAGMRGVAYTVFQGTKPEPMDVEVLGILKNANGPKGDIILVRLGGAKAEYTGVVAGMSGSPVYLNGKLAGAVAFRIGEFSKEPIAGARGFAAAIPLTLNETVNGENRVVAAPVRELYATTAPVREVNVCVPSSPQSNAPGEKTGMLVSLSTTCARIVVHAGS